MKRRSILVLLAAALMLFISPANGFAAQSADEPADGIEAYFPALADTRYVYEGSGSEYAAYDVFVDYIQGAKMQQRIDNGGTVLARVIEVKDGEAQLRYSREEAYYRENLLNHPADSHEVLLKEPLRAGTAWRLNDGRERQIQSVSAPVSTPSGDYLAVEVSTRSENGVSTDYYAKNIGLVKSVFTYGDAEVSSSLSAIEKDRPLIQTMRFFYPRSDGEGLDSSEASVSFHTNDITRIVLAQAYRNALAKPARVFSENTRINSLYLNRDGMAYIDLNRAFVEEMNAGSGYESMILQSVANTFGQYYGVDRVLLTIDTKLYESGHIALKKGEYLKVSPQ